MSIATLPAPVSARPTEWVSLADACWILGRETNPSAVKSIALCGMIRTLAIPGARIKYSRADCEVLVRAASAR
jgi:hypothetical protein